MSKDEIEELRKDPRLVKCAKKAGCTPDEFLNRVCKNAGVRVSKKTSK